jgi:hypothetical protein
MNADARLAELGVTRWDTAPPEQGRIRFCDRSGAVVGHGRYAVVLSYGPGDRYRMAWEIAAYRAAGIPVVGRDLAGEPAAVEGASRDAAWRRGQQIADAVGCDFLYWCDSLLVAVFDFTEGRSPAPAIGDAERATALLDARMAPATIAADMTGGAKRAVYNRLPDLGLRREMVTCVVFVLEGDAAETELSRDEVTAADVPGLISTYWRLTGWKQRVCMMHLLTDQDAPELAPLWLDILRAPDDGPGTGVHAAKALALARLEGDIDRFDHYFADHDQTERAARSRLLAHGDLP